ncbi:MAG: UbiA family prenyltransferase [Nitrososphaeria archaeon]|nr:UbiA family prenyltransferase [Nitrososphaeria archaeon]
MNLGLLSNIFSYIRLIRPSAPILISLVTFTGQTISLKAFPNFELILFPLLTSFLLTASSFVINDYLDFEIDCINRPNAPIPSGQVSRNSALYFGIILFILGFLSSIMLNWLAMLIALCTFLLSILYSLYGKKYGLLGNIIVSYCVSMTFIFGSITATGLIEPFIIAIFILSFFANLGREITQSISDMEGDKVKKVRSVAIIYGPKAAAILASVCYLITVFLGPMVFLYLFNKLDMLRASFVLASEIGFFYSIFFLIKYPSKERAMMTVKQINLWTIIVLVVIALIGLYF